jgi:hypothetical protein
MGTPIAIMWLGYTATYSMLENVLKWKNVTPMSFRLSVCLLRSRVATKLEAHTRNLDHLALRRFEDTILRSCSLHPTSPKLTSTFRCQ